MQLDCRHWDVWNMVLSYPMHCIIFSWQFFIMNMQYILRIYFVLIHWHVNKVLFFKTLNNCSWWNCILIHCSLFYQFVYLFFSACSRENPLLSQSQPSQTHSQNWEKNTKPFFNLRQTFKEVEKRLRAALAILCRRW